MAGRVNTKFVVLLVGAAVLVLGAGVGLYAYMFNKTGETYAIAAREAEAASDWKTAEERWGNAVGQEPTNVEYLSSWADAMGHITPATQTEYNEKILELRGIKRQIAVTARTDIEKTIDYIEFFYKGFVQPRSGFRSTAENFDTEMGLMLAYYPEGGPLNDQRNRLRRYRAMAWAALAGPGSTLTEEEIDSAIADAEAALSADPADGEAMRAMVELIDTRKLRAEADGNRNEVEAIRQQQRDVVAKVLEADPDSFWGNLTAIEIDAELYAKLSGEARKAARGPLAARLFALMDSLDDRAGDLEPGDLDNLTLLETILSDDDSMPRTIALYEKVTEAQPDRTDLLLQLARLRNRAGDYEGSIADAERAEAQPRLPVSLEGFIRLFAKRQAPMLIAEFAVTQLEKAETEADVDEIVQVAQSARDRFVENVSIDDPRVALLDGQIAAARAQQLLNSGDQRGGEDALTEALRHFSTYNERTNYERREGLWREGLTALRLNKTGLARERLEALLAMEPNNANVLLGLADIEEILGTPESLKDALAYTLRALDIAPGIEAIQERVTRLRQRTFQEKVDDPIDQVVFESERVFQGIDALSPDAIKAEEILREGIDEHGLEPRIVRQLVRILMLTDRLDEAGELAQQGADANPDSEIMQTLQRRLKADSILEIVEQSIQESNVSELDKLLLTVEARRQYGEPELAAEALAKAIELAPDDPDVIEQQFLQEIARRDLEAAKRTAARAKSLDADRLGGITFDARVLAAEGKHAEAVELFREAVAQQPAEAALWRLLASEQAEMGRIPEALESYRKSLGITVNDATTIRGYIALLASAGQYEEALSEARRLRSFGESDPVFVDIYLRLEATQGGDEGLATAINQRRQILGERPFDTNNKLQLSRLYIDARQWNEAKSILDELGEEGVNTLARVEMLAKWYADQGRVKVGEEYRDGIELARGAFIEHIIAAGEESTVDAYLAMAQFMLQRGRDDVALRAVEEARGQQDPTQLRAEKLYGEILMRRNLPRQAAEAFRSVVDAGADADGTYRMLLIEMLLRTNEFEAAGEQIAQLDERARNELTVLMQSADIAMAGGDQDEALRIVDRAIERYPSRPLPFVKRAQYLMPNEALSRDVVRNLEEALRLNPNDFQAHKLMATMHYRNKDDDAAIASLRESLRANPGQDGVLVGLLIELLEKDRVGEAIDVANEVIEARPTDATLMLVTGRVFMRRGHYDRASSLFEQAWNLTRDQRVAMAFIDALLRSDSPKISRATRVIGELEVLGANINEDPQLLATRAAIEAKGGKQARAASFLTRAYEQSLGNPGLVLQWFRNVRVAFEDDGAKTVAYLRGLQGEMPSGTVQRDWITYGIAQTLIQDETGIDEAESALAGLQADSSNDIIKRLAHRLLGSGRYGREDYAGAEAAWRDGIAAYPDDWEMHNNLAYCVGIDLGRPADAVPLARQATQLADARADVHDTLGKLLLETGALDEAEDSLLRAKERIRTERERVNVLLNQARLALARGKVSEAKRLYTEADTTVYTLPDLREVVGDSLKEVKDQIDSAQAAD